MTSSPAEEIKQKLDIAELLRTYLALVPAGKNFKALCPFHKEKTPSFMISPDRQSWHCFGCGIGGDIFAFVMRYENLEFGEALRVLAEKAGVELRRLNPAEYRFTGLLYELNQIAKEFFRKELERSEPARKYLAERGLKSEIISEFELGWAPNQPEALVFHLVNAGYRPEDILQAGLSFKTDRGKQMDRFRGRIMFPIHNHFGKVVGFTGRILPQLDNGQSGKYVNSPETPIFSKSKLIYGYWRTKDSIREAGSAFLVEGQMDFLMSYQAGIKNVIACSGTALTPDHLRTLRRLADTLYLSFDSDSAGMAAGERAIDLAEANDFQVKVVTLGKFKDPAEAVQNDPKNLEKGIAGSKPAPQFYFDRYLVFGASPRDREFLRGLRIILGKLKGMASAVECSYWLQELGKRTGVPENALREEMERIASGGDTGEAKTEQSRDYSEAVVSRWELLSQRLLSAMLAVRGFELLGEHVNYLAPGYGEVLRLLSQDVKRTEDPRKDAILEIILLRSEPIAETEVGQLKEQLLREYVKERRRSLAEEAMRAQLAGEEEQLRSALETLAKLPTLD